MAVRIQFRRGTAAEWASANPTLAAGELGYEVDTAQIKIGNAVDAWGDLAYAAVSASYVDDAIANVVGLAPETLDTLNELAAAIGDDGDFANTVSANIQTAISDHNAVGVNVHGIADTAELETLAGAQTKANAAQANAQSYADTAIAGLLDSAPETLNTLNELAAALGDDPNFATTVSTTLGTKLSFIVDDHSDLVTENAVTVANTIYITPDSPGYVRLGDGVTHYNDLDFIAQDYVDLSFSNHNQPTSGAHGISDFSEVALTPQVALDIAAATASASADLEVAVTQIGLDIESAVSAHNENAMDVHGIPDTSVLVVASDLADYATLAGLEQAQQDIDSLESASELLAPLSNPSFTGTVVLPADTSIGNVTDQEISYLDGVTSSIQSQLGTKADTENAEITISAILPQNTVIGVVLSDEIEALSGVTSSIQEQLDDKAPSADAIFTGVISLPSSTSIGDVSATSISYLENVSADVQAQLDGKIDNSVVYSQFAQLNGPTFTGSVALPSTTSVGDVDASELGHLNGVTSGIQGQLDAKAPLESPTFTGTVSGVTSSMVGLGNVDNTSDANKAVSIAAQAALDAKLDLAGGTMTGRITLSADPTQALHAVTKQYVDSVEAGLLTRPQVRAATTANLDSTYNNGTAGVGATLTATANGAFPLIDGVALTTVNGDRGLLVKNQTDAAENGRYNLTTQGDAETPWVLTRCSLCDEADEIPGSYTFVTDGDINGQTGWVQYVDDPTTFTVGTDDIDVFQFAGAGSITGGTNISVNGNEISVVSNPTFTDKVTLSANGIQFADGTIQTGAGVVSLTEFTEKTTSYTLDTLTHQDNVVEMNSSSPTTFTIPTNATLAWPVGASMDIFQMGTGQVTIANAVGVTLNFTPGNKLRTQFSSCTIMKRGTDSWVLYGDLTA